MARAISPLQGGQLILELELSGAGRTKAFEVFAPRTRQPTVALESEVREGGRERESQEKTRTWARTLAQRWHGSATMLEERHLA